jgi:hypothetical protein
MRNKPGPVIWPVPQLASGSTSRATRAMTAPIRDKFADRMSHLLAEVTMKKWRRHAGIVSVRNNIVRNVEARFIKFPLIANDVFIEITLPDYRV